MQHAPKDHTFLRAIVKSMKQTRGFVSHGTLVAATGIAIAFLIAVGWYAETRHSGSASSVATSTAPLVTIETVGSTTTYTNHQFNFSISYPSSLSAATSTDVWGPYMANLKHGEMLLVLPHVSRGGGTRGAFLVLASVAEDDLHNCTTTSAQTEAGRPPLHVTSINGTTFAHYEAGQPAAGQFESDSVYKTRRGNTCYAVDETYAGIETSHLQGSEAVQNDADIAAVSDELDSIMQSWLFLAPVNPAPSCTLSASASSYAVGDPISLSWTAQNATSASWEEPVNPKQPDTLVPPAGTPGVSGSATAVANIAGTHAIALDVEGPGGLASCSVSLTVTPSNKQPMVSVTTLREAANPPGVSYTNRIVLSMSGTIQNATLLNSNGLDVIFVDAAYNGPTDWGHLFWHVNMNDLDRHPMEYGEYGEAPVSSTSTTWSVRFYNDMPPGDYRFYIFPAQMSGLSTSTELLASGNFHSVSWSTDPNVEIIYPRSGSDMWSGNGGTSGAKKIFWTVPQSVVDSFPSDFNLSMMLYAENEANPGVSIAINDGNAFLPGFASWNIDNALKVGNLTPGTYRITWHLQADPVGPGRACAQMVDGECEPSAADQAVMLRAQQINGETGWFVIDK